VTFAPILDFELAGADVLVGLGLTIGIPFELVSTLVGALIILSSSLSDVDVE